MYLLPKRSPGYGFLLLLVFAFSLFHPLDFARAQDCNDPINGCSPNEGSGGQTGSQSSGKCPVCSSIEAALGDLLDVYYYNDDGSPGPGSTVGEDQVLVTGDDAVVAGLAGSNGLEQDVRDALSIIDDGTTAYDSIVASADESAGIIAESGFTANSSQAGDPNILASGTLFVEETDLSYSLGSLCVSVSRFHRSDRTRWSSLGRSWFLSYDSRILLGTSPGMSTLATRLAGDAGNISQLERSKRELIDNLVARLGMDLAWRARPRLSSARGRLLECQQIYQQLVSLRSSDRRNYLLQQAGELLATMQGTVAAYEGMVWRLERDLASLESLKNNPALLSRIRGLVEPLLQLSRSAAAIGAVSSANEEKNCAALRSGDPPAAVKGGVGTATLIDETGLPHLYRFQRSPTLVDGHAAHSYQDGSPNYYPDGSRLAPERADDPEMVLAADGSWQVRYHSGTVNSYGFDGLLQGVRDRNGNAFFVHRDPSGVIRAIEDDRGRRTVFESENGRVAAITDPVGRTIRYIFDGAGRIETVTDAVGDSVRYSYEEDRLSHIRKPDGSEIAYSYAFHAGKWVLSTTTDEEGGHESFQYGGGYTVHTDPSGIRTTHFFDDQCLEVRTENVDGTAKTSSFDEQGHLIEEVNEVGEATRYERDLQGNPLSTIYPDGTRERRSFNAWGQTVESTDGRGTTTRRGYDSRGNLVELQWSDGTSERRSYDSKGNLLSETDEIGGTVRYGYDSYGYLSSVTNPGGATRRYEHDAVGRCTSIIDEEGGVTRFEYRPDGLVSSIIDPKGSVERFQYDERKDLVARIDKLGKLTRYTYDRRHLCVQEEDPAGRVRRFRYRPDRRVAEVEAPDGSITTYEYDRRGKLSSILQSETESRRSFHHDAAGRLSGFVDANGNEWKLQRDTRGNIIARIDPLEGQQRFQYDANGNLTAFTDELGNRMEYIYDARNRLTSLRYPTGEYLLYSYFPNGTVAAIRETNGATTRYRYDSCARLREVENALGDATRFSYSPSGHLTSIVDATGRTVHFAYDRVGMISKIVDPLGGVIELRRDSSGRLVSVSDQLSRMTTYTYDAVGRLTAAGTPEGERRTFRYGAIDQPESITDQGGGTWRYSYDPDGRLLALTGPSGESAQFRYDKNGNFISYLDPSGSQKQFRYDELNRMSSVINQDGSQTSWSFDPTGNLLSRCDALGRCYRWSYDARSRLVAERDQAGSRRSYRYEGGNLVSETGFSGSVIRYDYDALRRLVKKSYSDGSSSSYSYGAAGNLIAASNQAAEYRFAYDAANRLVSSTSVGRSSPVEYSYDPVGNLLAVSHDANQTRIEYDYGKENELLRIRDPNGGSTRFEYDSAGREVSRRLPNGVVERRTYDASGNPRSFVVRSPAALSLDLPGGVIWGRGYLCDASGRRLFSVGHDGSVTRFRYDPVGRLTGIDCPSSEGDTVSSALASLGIALPVGSSPIPTEADHLALSPKEEAKIRSLFDECLPLSKRLFNPQQKVIPITYRYDQAGNRIAEVTPWGTVEYTYGPRNEIIAAGNRHFECDSAGNLSKERAGQGEVLYSYSPEGRLESVDFSASQPTEESRKPRAEQDPRMIRYRYDPLGRRVSRTLYFASISPEDSSQPDALFSSTTLFQYDGLGFDRVRSLSLDPVAIAGVHASPRKLTGSRYRYLGRSHASLSPKTNASSLGIRVLGPGGLMQILTPTGSRYFSQDFARTIIAVTDSTGRRTPFPETTPFGRPAHATSPPATAPGFAGKDLDPLTHFYDFGMRDYYPLIGRWTSPDPIMAGTNWFAYTENDPINFTDPNGLLLMPVSKTYYQDWNPASGQQEDYREVPIGILADDADPRQTPETIGSAGCLLTAATRIANSLNHTEAVTPSSANEVAKRNGLFFPASNGQIDELTPSSTANLISALTGLDVEATTFRGETETLRDSLSELNADGVEHYVVAELSDGDSSNPSTHFVNVQAISEDGRVVVADTSSTDRSFSDERAETIVGLTEFSIKGK